MLRENRIGKYLLYAFGEILLVVAGIFIAIQLDQWNDQRIQAKENRELLGQLVEDLARDTTRINNLIRGFPGSRWIGQREAMDNCEKALNWTYDGLTPERIDSLLLITLTAGNPLFNTETGVFKELTSTAKLYKIGSASLVQDIKAYYSRAEREHLYNRTNAEVINNARTDMRFWYQIKLDSEMKPDFNVKDYPWLFDPNSEKYRLFQISLSERSRSEFTNLEKFHIVDEMAKELIKKISTELDR